MQWNAAYRASELAANRDLSTAVAHGVKSRPAAFQVHTAPYRMRSDAMNFFW
jgi:hypothetical protein